MAEEKGKGRHRPGYQLVLCQAAQCPRHSLPAGFQNSLFPEHTQVHSPAVTWPCLSLPPGHSAPKRLLRSSEFIPSHLFNTLSTFSKPGHHKLEQEVRSPCARRQIKSATGPTFRGVAQC